MKVTKGNQGFRGIILELETKQEADALWHVLNNNGKLTDYWERRCTPFEEKIFSSLVVNLWDLLNGVHHPTR